VLSLTSVFLHFCIAIVIVYISLVSQPSAIQHGTRQSTRGDRSGR